MNSRLPVTIALTTFTGTLGMLSATANAGISYTGLNTDQSYEQTAFGTTYLGSSFNLALDTAAATDFTAASVVGPGQTTPSAFNWPPVLTFDGSYAVFAARSGYPSSSPSASLLAMNTAHPFGTYTFTATNSNTNAQQVATLNYDANYYLIIRP